MLSIEYCIVLNIDYGYVYDNGLSGNVFNVEYCIVLC